MQSPINQTQIPVGLHGSLTSEAIEAKLQVLFSEIEELEKKRAEMIETMLRSMFEKDIKRLTEKGSKFQERMATYFEQPRDHKDRMYSRSWTFQEQGMFWDRDLEYKTTHKDRLMNDIAFEDGDFYGILMKSKEEDDLKTLKKQLDDLKTLKKQLDELFRAESDQMNIQVVINDENPLPEKRQSIWHVNNFYQHKKDQIKLHEDRRKEIKLVEGKITEVRTQLEKLCKSRN